MNGRIDSESPDSSKALNRPSGPGGPAGPVPVPPDGVRAGTPVPDAEAPSVDCAGQDRDGKPADPTPPGTDSPGTDAAPTPHARHRSADHAELSPGTPPRSPSHRTATEPPARNDRAPEPGSDEDETEARVVMRGPADLIDALPYLLGFHPQQGLVLIGMTGCDARIGACLRLPLPADRGEWASLALRAADHVVNGGGPGRRPDAVALCLLDDPGSDETATDVMRRLRPLAQHVRRACGVLDVPVVEAVCVSGRRWWSYLCVTIGCCPPEGTPVPAAGTSVLAATAAYAGVRIRGTLSELRSRLTAPPGRRTAQRNAFDDASAELVPRMLAYGDTDTVREETLVLAAAAIERLRAAPGHTDTAEGDRIDDGIVGDDEAATIVLGLQDRETRDRAASWMEPDEAPHALRLWRALSRRCVGPYAGHAAAPLTLAGWVAWANGDAASARVALGMALEADPDYLFAQLLNRACNHGLDPEPLRESLRRERSARTGRPPRAPRTAGTAPGRRPGRPGAGTHPSGTHPGTPRSHRRRARSGNGEAAAW